MPPARDSQPRASGSTSRSPDTGQAGPSTAPARRSETNRPSHEPSSSRSSSRSRRAVTTQRRTPDHSSASRPPIGPSVGPPPALSPSHPRPRIVASNSSSRATSPTTSRGRSGSRRLAPASVPMPPPRASPSPASSRTESETEDERSQSSGPSRRTPLQTLAGASMSRRNSPPAEAIVIGSSDEDSDAADDDGPRRHYEEGDSFVVERVVRRTPPTIEIGDVAPSPSYNGEDDDDEFELAALLDPELLEAELEDPPHNPAPPPAKRPRLEASPPRPKPPPLAYPLVSTFHCPICLCAPEDAVTTPCGHVFCSQCLFGALKHASTGRLEQDRIRAFSMGRHPFNNNAARGGTANAGATARNTGSSGGSGAQDTPNEDTAAGAATEEDPATAARRRDMEYRKGLDPLYGKCPNCRADIPGGFIYGAGSRAAKHRPVFGLIFKTGKPIDDVAAQSKDL